MKIKILLLLLISGINFNCNKEQVCEIIEKADMISDIALSTSSIVIGQNASAINKVTNLLFSAANQALDCDNIKTESASISNSQFDIFYREDENSDWSLIPEYANLILDIKALIGGGLDEQDVEYTFNQSGQYRWFTTADLNDVVPERDESNNEADLSGRGVLKNNSVWSDILTVLPDSNIIIPPNSAMVKIVSITRLN